MLKMHDVNAQIVFRYRIDIAGFSERHFQAAHKLNYRINVFVNLPQA
jgi:hypothetical protein